MANINPKSFPAICQEREDKQARWVREYLEDECEHLREGIRQHKDLIGARVYINQMVKEVRQFAKEGAQTLNPKILRRLADCETVSVAQKPQVSTVESCNTVPKDHPVIKGLLKEIEELTQTDMVKESWASFESVRKPLEQVLALLEALPVADPEEPKELSAKDSQLRIKRNLRKKIDTFNGVYEACPETMGDTCRLFKNCFSASRCSLNLINDDTPIVPEKDSGCQGDATKKPIVKAGKN